MRGKSVWFFALKKKTPPKKAGFVFLLKDDLFGVYPILCADF